MCAVSCQQHLRSRIERGRGLECGENLPKHRLHLRVPVLWTHRGEREQPVLGQVEARAIPAAQVDELSRDQQHQDDADQSLVDVTELQGRVALGAEVVLIGRQGDAVIEADEWADKLGTINYEIVTAISRRVPRIAVGGS